MAQEPPVDVLDDSLYPPDDEIDFTDNPETEDWEWKYARRFDDPEAWKPGAWDAYREELYRRYPDERPKAKPAKSE